jgi:hypothetical protein
MPRHLEKRKNVVEADKENAVNGCLSLSRTQGLGEVRIAAFEAIASRQMHCRRKRAPVAKAAE